MLCSTLDLVTKTKAAKISTMHPVCVVLRAALHWNGIPRPGKVRGHRPRHLHAPHAPGKLALLIQPNGKRAAPGFSAVVPT